MLLSTILAALGRNVRAVAGAGGGAGARAGSGARSGGRCCRRSGGKNKEAQERSKRRNMTYDRGRGIIFINLAGEIMKIMQKHNFHKNYDPKS